MRILHRETCRAFPVIFTLLRRAAAMEEPLPRVSRGVRGSQTCTYVLSLSRESMRVQWVQVWEPPLRGLASRRRRCGLWRLPPAECANERPERWVIPDFGKSRTSGNRVRAPRSPAGAALPAEHAPRWLGQLIAPPVNDPTLRCHGGRPIQGRASSACNQTFCAVLSCRRFGHASATVVGGRHFIYRLNLELVPVHN